MDDVWNDDVTDFELLTASEGSEFLIGRAILGVNDEEIFLRPFDTYLSDIQESISKANVIEALPAIVHDKFYLFLLTKAPCNETVIIEKWKRKWSGCIILELIVDEYIGMTNTQYIGILFFSKNVLRRDQILQQSWFNKQDLLSHNCVIEWFSPSLKYQLLASQQVQFKINPCYFILWPEAILLIANDVMNKTSVSTYNCLTSKWQIMTCIDKWINHTGLLQIFNSLPNSTTINFLECLFLFFHISLRMYRRHIPPLHIFVKILQQIKKITPNSVDIETISEKMIQQLGEIGCNEFVITNLFRQFTSYLDIFKKSVELYSSIVKCMADKRKIFHAFEIFTNHKLDNIVAKSIESAPTSYFEHEEIQVWVDNIYTFIENELSMPDLFDKIKNGLTYTNKNGCFHLYETLDIMVAIINNSPSYQCKYEIKSGSLSQSLPELKSEQTTPFWKSNKFILPWNIPGNNISPTKKRCILAFNLRSPIWCQWKNSFHDYFWVERTTANKGITIDKILSSIYLSSEMSYNHEVINPYLNISNVLLDIDIKDVLNPTLIETIQQNKPSFIKDLISLIHIVFDQLSVKSSDVTLYIFENNKINTSKQSFHVHVGLPHNIVIESQVDCVEIVNILNTLRHFYPDTLGLPYCDIFDDGIYNKKGGIHSLRGPYQLKHDGSTKLECIYRSDNKPLSEPIPVQRQFIHGGQNNNYEGTIIHEIKNTFLISDNFFLDQTQNNKLDETTKKMCLSNISGLIEEINKYIVLFNQDNLSENITLLEEIINSIWKLSKAKIVHWMTTEDYSIDHIRYIQHKCQFKVDLSDNSIRLVNLATYSPNIPVCLRYNHHNHTHSTWYRILFRNGMKCFLLVNKCFKGRCKDKRVISHRLDVIPIFFAPHIKDCLQIFLQSFKMVDYLCIEIVKSEHQQIKQIKKCPNDKDVLSYLLNNGINKIARLVLFINNKYLCCRLANNYYVLIIKSSNIVIFYANNESVFHEFIHTSQTLDTHTQNSLRQLFN